MRTKCRTRKTKLKRRRRKSPEWSLESRLVTKELQTLNRRLKRLVPILLNWFSANARDLPWRRTRDPYAIWVSEIMLQQTQVKTVIPFWKRWMHELPTIESAAKAPSAKIHKLWEGLGYYTRVRNLQKAARVIVEKHDGKFPEKFEDVLALPGIGRYTAGAICSIAFNQPTPILDGNVIRVLTRVFGIGENPTRKENESIALANCGRTGVSCEDVSVGRDSRRAGSRGRSPHQPKLFASEPVADGTGRAGLHAAKPAMPDLPGKKPLRRFQGKSH